MARVEKNPITIGNVGAFGKLIVFKQVNGKTIMTKYPDRSRVKYNENQKEYQNLFAQAIEYARSVMRDPVRTAAYRKKIHANSKLRGASVYHAAIKAFMQKHSRKVSETEANETIQKLLNNYTFTDRQEKAIRYLVTQGKLTTALYERLNAVSKATAKRDLKSLLNLGVIDIQSKGAATNYKLAYQGHTDNAASIFGEEDNYNEEEPLI